MKNRIAKITKIIAVEVTRLFQFLLATLAIDFIGSMFGPFVAALSVASVVIMFTFYYRFKFVRTMYIATFDDNKIIKGILK